MLSWTILLLLVGGVSGLKVIGAGPGRSGTDSMKQALLDLGFGEQATTQFIHLPRGFWDGKRPLLSASCNPAFRATENTALASNVLYKKRERERKTQYNIY